MLLFSQILPSPCPVQWLAGWGSSSGTSGGARVEKAKRKLDLKCLRQWSVCVSGQHSFIGNIRSENPEGVFLFVGLTDRAEQQQQLVDIALHCCIACDLLSSRTAIKRDLNWTNWSRLNQTEPRLNLTDPDWTYSEPDWNYTEPRVNLTELTLNQAETRLNLDWT